jgi:hypothetical protein
VDLADEEDPAEAAQRLEQALERIARLAQAAHTAGAQPPAEHPGTAEVAARLDTLIAQLRASLDPASGS